MADLRELPKLVQSLPDEWENNARGVREFDATDSCYRHYWRGYAVALESCARVLRARTTGGQ